MFSADFAYYTSYKTKDDRWLSIGCIEPWLWNNFCDAVERPDLKDCAFIRDHFYEEGGTTQDEARREVADIIKTRTRDEWWEFLTRADVCVGKVYAVEEVFQDPQVVHRKMILEHEHPVAGTIRQPGVPVKLSKTPGEVRSLPPYHGEHTEELLDSLGYSSAEFKDLREKGIV